MTIQDKDFLHDTLAGLNATRKTLNPKWLYDRRGSALFEQITGLPEYYPTRTEVSILQQNATMLAGLVPDNGALVEFGSGASIKTRILLDAGAHFGAYIPIDVSADFLHETAQDLRQRYPDLAINPITGDFLAPVTLPDDMAKVGFFPGSTIGNIDPADAINLLTQARNWPDVSGFILGVDLVKDPDTLVAAYDDSAGVTAQFIKNILVRLNRELDADFDLQNFTYHAHWNAGKARIEMALVSDIAQSVTISDQQISFAKGEPIHVSQSRKYTQQSVTDLAHASGWNVTNMLQDPDAQFAVAVLLPA